MADSLSQDRIKELVDVAREAGKRAYSPYSRFSVGAAVLCSDGTVFTGCNVENVSYGLTICAERTALFKAVSEGYRDFRAVAIYAATGEYCAPCGACRQVIAEFGRDIIVIQADRDGRYIVNTIEELLPGGFTAETLGKKVAE